MYPQGGRRGSDSSSPTNPFPPLPNFAPAQTTSSSTTGQQLQTATQNHQQPQRSAVPQDDLPLSTLEAGVSPIGGVYYASTPQALRLPEQLSAGSSTGHHQNPASPSASSTSSSVRRPPSPSRVRKPVFGVKGAYSSMAARRYAAALAASGHAHPEVLAEAIQAAAAEAEGNRRNLLTGADPSAAAAEGASAADGGAGAQPLRGFNSSPGPAGAAPHASSSSKPQLPAGANASGAVLQSRQVASLVSPRLMNNANASQAPAAAAAAEWQQSKPKHDTFKGAGGPNVVAAGTAALLPSEPFGQWGAAGSQQMTPKTPGPADAKTLGLDTPISIHADSTAPFGSPARSDHPGMQVTPTATTSPDWQVMGTPQWPAPSCPQQRVDAAAPPSATDERVDIPVASGVMGTLMRLTGFRPSTSESGCNSPSATGPQQVSGQSGLVTAPVGHPAAAQLRSGPQAEPPTGQRVVPGYMLPTASSAAAAASLSQEGPLSHRARTGGQSSISPRNNNNSCSSPTKRSASQQNSKGAAAAAAVAAAAGASSVVIAGMVQQSGSPGGRKPPLDRPLSPTRSGSPSRNGSPTRGRVVARPLSTLLSLQEGGVDGSGQAATSSAAALAAAQQQQQPIGPVSPQSSQLPPGVAYASAGAGAAAGGAMSRPVDLVSMHGSSSASSALSHDWQNPVGNQDPPGGSNQGSSMQWATPMVSSAQPTSPQLAAGTSGMQQPQGPQQPTAAGQQQQQENLAAQSSQGGAQAGLLGSLWTLFSGTSRSDMATPRTHTGASGHGAAADPSSSQAVLQHKQQSSAPSGAAVAAGAVAIGATAAAAAGAAAAHAAGTAQNSSGHSAVSSIGHYSLDPVTGMVVNNSPQVQQPSGAAAGMAHSNIGGGQHAAAMQPAYLQSLEEMDAEDQDLAANRSPQSGLGGAAAATTAATLFGSAGGMGHGTPPGHAVFAPGAVHGPVVTSYAPVVGGASSGSINHSSSALGGDGYNNNAATGHSGQSLGMLGMGAAAAGGAGMMSAGLFRQHHPHMAQECDLSSMFSNASSYGEPLQPQRLPPATWPAEALPSPTGSDSMHSAFDPDSAAGFSGSGPQQQQPHMPAGFTEGIPGLPRLNPGQPELEPSDGGAAAGAAFGVAAGAMAAGAAAAGMMGHHGAAGASASHPSPDNVEQPLVRIKLDPAAPGSPRRRSKVAQTPAEAAAGQQATTRQQSSGGQARRKSGLGALWGVSAWDSKHNKPGKKHPTSPEPGAPSPEVPTPQEQKKRRTGGGAHSSRSKKQRLVCILVPLVILAVLGGIAAAIGITMTQQKQHAQARAATKAAAQPAPARTTPGPPLAFKVNVTVPPDEKGKPGPTCAGLFGPQGDKARLESYLSAFRQAYAKALNISASDIKIGSLACDGKAVKEPKARTGSGGPANKGADASAKPPPAHKRALLDAQDLTDMSSGAASRALQQAAKPAVLTTEFTVPAPSEPVQRSDLASTITELSPQILEGSMSDFFGRPVQVQPAVQQPLLPAPPAKAPAKPAAKPSPRPPPPPVESKPTAAAPPAAPVATPNATAPPTAVLEEPATVGVEEQQQPQAPASGTFAAPRPAAPKFPEKPPQQRPPRPAPTVAPKPSLPPPQAEAPPTPLPKPAGPSWPRLPIFRPPGQHQQSKPWWHFGQQKPAPSPPPQSAATWGSAAPSPPPVSAPASVEEATPVMVTVPPPPPKGSPAPYPVAPAEVSTFAWPSAPACKGKANGHTATPDAEGRLWGWENGRSCAFKTFTNTPVTITWENAASCSGRATTSNSVFDSNGRLWGWQDGRSCAYRGAGVQAPPVPGQEVVTWEAAASCSGSPDARNSVRNPQGQLWGWENGKSCAFRIQNGVHTISWAAAPVCKGKPNHFTSIRDKLGRLWGWENNESCRFANPS